MNSGLLSALIYLPLIAAGLIILLPNVYKQYFRWITAIALVIMWISFGSFVSGFDTAKEGYQFVEHVEWIRLSLGKTSLFSIDYIIGVDGLSMVMLFLTLIVFSIAAMSSDSINKKEKAYYTLFLLMMGSVIGCFVALDFFLFFIFFEFMLLPMYFLIGIWGGANRSYASLKFLIYTLVGSILILVVMLALSLSYSDEFFSNEYKKIVHSFDFRLLEDLKNLRPYGFLSLSHPQSLLGLSARGVMFFLLLLGFGIKLPIVPFHTWLPDAHVEAPTPISVILAGILLKIGGYGLIRIMYGFFPDYTVQYASLIGVLGLIAIIYAGFNALGQSDLKKLIAYSSISHMGFVMIGIASLNSEGLNGAVFQMFSHGLLSAMLFISAGVIYDRTKNRDIKNFKGLMQKMPMYSVFVGIAFFASLGLPGFSGFIGEFFTLFGGFQSKYLPKYISIVGVIGIIISAVYFLWTYQKMFFGAFVTKENFEDKLVDLNRMEITMLAILTIFVIFFGIFPNVIFEFTNTTINHILK